MFLQKKILAEKQSGFTLIELIISVALTSILMLGGVLSLIKLIETSKTIDEQVTTTTSTDVMVQILPKYLGMAINVDWTASNIVDLGANKGRLRLFNSGFNLTQQPPINVGLFLRETGSPNAGNSRGNIKATAFYFTNPTPDSPGEFRITTSGSGEGLKSLYSDASVHTFTDLVGLSISPAGHPSAVGDPVRTVRIQLTSRKFYSGGKSNWCTQAAIDGSLSDCATRPSTFRDIQKTIFVNLINNRISDESVVTASGEVKRESLYGSMYFFRPVRIR